MTERARPVMVAGAMLAGVLVAAGIPAARLPVAVVSFDPGTNAGFGQDHFPDNVLRGPDGGDNPPFVPQASPMELLSLGEGGSIVLDFGTEPILDGPGADFIVFENVFINLANGAPFAECGIVAVGNDPNALVEFPFRFEPPAGWNPASPYALPFFEENYVGLAGTRPTLATPTNGIDPADPAAAGGNAFDLADVGLTHARYVRITDPGRPGTAGARTGTNGLEIFDAALPGNGFDLDTVVAIHHGPLPSSTAAGWTLYE